MQKDKMLSMIGIARRAGALIAGHDAAVNAVFSGKASLIILASDLSPRAKRDMRIIAQKHGGGLPVAEAEITIEEIGGICGINAGILAVCNTEISKKLILLANE